MVLKIKLAGYPDHVLGRIPGQTGYLAVYRVKYQISRISRPCIRPNTWPDWISDRLPDIHTYIHNAGYLFRPYFYLKITVIEKKPGSNFTLNFSFNARLSKLRNERILPFLEVILLYEPVCQLLRSNGQFVLVRLAFLE